MAYIRHHAVVPYTNQPPPFIRHRTDGVGAGLVFSSAHPYLYVQHYTKGFVKAAPGTGVTNQEYDVNSRFGKVLRVTNGNANPVHFPELNGPLPLSKGWTVMISYRKIGVDIPEGKAFAFGGSSGQGGFAIAIDTAYALTGDGTDSVFPGVPQQPPVDVDHVVIMTVTENSTNGDVIFHYARQNSYEFHHMHSPTQKLTGSFGDAISPLTLGSAWNSNQAIPGYVDTFTGHIGPVAMWERVLTETEIEEILGNPFALWLEPAYGQYQINSYDLSASAGSFALSGVAANLRYLRTIPGASASYTLTPHSASLTVTRKLTAAAGSFALTGKTVNLFKGRFIPVAAGTFALSGTATNLRYNRKAIATLRTHALTGSNAVLTVSRLLSAASRAFSLTGGGVTFTVVRKSNFGRSRAATMEYFEQLHQQKQAEVRKLLADQPLANPQKPAQKSDKKPSKQSKKPLLEEIDDDLLDDDPLVTSEPGLHLLKDYLASQERAPGLSMIQPEPTPVHDPKVFSYQNALAKPNTAPAAIDPNEFSYAAHMAKKGS